jgi:hypothetical protein
VNGEEDILILSRNAQIPFLPVRSLVNASSIGLWIWLNFGRLGGDCGFNYPEMKMVPPGGWADLGSWAKSGKAQPCGEGWGQRKNRGEAPAG